MTTKTEPMQLSQLELAEMVLAKQSEVDALTAHMERLRGAIAKFERSHEEIEYDDKLGVFFESDVFDELSGALEVTVEQNLAERDARLAREHFIYGYGFCRANGFLYHEQLQEAANEYADRVKRGEV